MLLYPTYKLLHYLLARCLKLVTKSIPLKYSLSWLAMSRLTSWWHHYHVSYGDMKLCPIWSVRAFPLEEHKALCKDMHYEEVCTIEDHKWLIAFNSSFSHRGGGIWILLYASGIKEEVAVMFLYPSSSSSLIQKMNLRWSYDYKTSFCVTNGKAIFTTRFCAYRSTGHRKICSYRNCPSGLSNNSLELTYSF